MRHAVDTADHWWLDPDAVRARRIAMRRAAGLPDEIEDDDALDRIAQIFADMADDALDRDSNT